MTNVGREAGDAPRSPASPSGQGSRWAKNFRVLLLVRSSLWLLPSCYVVGAVVLGAAAPLLDRWVSLRASWAPQAENTRAVLSAVGTGMITLTGFVFSFLLLMVQFGSTAFSPRLTRTLQRDWVVKNALGAFSATFVFSLSALIQIGHVRSGVLPVFTVATVTSLLLASIALFFAMISRSVNNLRASRVIRLITDHGHRVLDATYPHPHRDLPEGSGTAAPVELGEPVQVVRHTEETSTILVALDRDCLAGMARQAGATIEYVPAVGDDIAPGTDLFRVYGGGPVPEDMLISTLVLGDERTLEDDPGFALRLLVDISSRALSAAVNDPTTAVRALDGIGELLHHAATRDLDAVVGTAADGVGVVGPTPSWEDLLRLGTTEIRVYGSHSVQVLRRLRALLESLLARTPSSRHAALREELTRLDTTVHEGFGNDADRVLAAEPDPQGLGATRPYQGVL